MTARACRSCWRRPPAAGSSSPGPARLNWCGAASTADRLLLWDAAYARRYEHAVRRDAAGQSERVPGKTALPRRSRVHDLMAYKDEYRGMRAFSDGRFDDEVAERFEGDYRLHFHLCAAVLGRPQRSAANSKRNLRSPGCSGSCAWRG